MRCNRDDHFPENHCEPVARPASQNRLQRSEGKSAPPHPPSHRSDARRPLPRDGGGEVGAVALLEGPYEKPGETHLSPATAGERSPQTRRVKAGEGEQLFPDHRTLAIC